MSVAKCSFRTEEETRVESMQICDKLVCQASGFVFYTAPLPAKQIVDQIQTRFPLGLSDYSCFPVDESAPALPSAEDLCFVFSPAVADNTSKMVQNMAAAGGEVWGKLTGNSGVVQHPTETMRVKYLFPIANILPAVRLLSENANEVLKTARVMLGNLHRFAEGTIRLRKEAAEFAKTIIV